MQTKAKSSVCQKYPHVVLILRKSRLHWTSLSLTVSCSGHNNRPGQRDVFQFPISISSLNSTLIFFWGEKSITQILNIGINQPVQWHRWRFASKATETAGGRAPIHVWSAVKSWDHAGESGSSLSQTGVSFLSGKSWTCTWGEAAQKWRFNVSHVVQLLLSKTRNRLSLAELNASMKKSNQDQDQESPYGTLYYHVCIAFYGWLRGG